MEEESPTLVKVDRGQGHRLEFAGCWGGRLLVGMGVPFSCEAIVGELELKEQGQDLQADIVEIDGGTIERVDAETVSIFQGGVRQAVAGNLEMRLGAAGSLQASTARLEQVVAGAVRGNAVEIIESDAAAVMGGEINAEHSRIGIALADSIHMDQGSSLIMLTREIRGEVTTVLDTRGAMVAGLLAGMAAGAILFITSRFTRGR